MGLRDIVVGGIATAKGIIGGNGGLMDTVTIQYWLKDLDDSGTGDYSSPVSYEAIVNRVQQMVKKSDGQEAMARTYVAFLQELPAHGESGRDEPLDERDIITLSDGTTGPILSITGLMDSTTHTPYLLEVYLG